MSVVIGNGGGGGGGASDWGSITGKPTINTTVGDPGSDSDLVSEQAVREALDALTPAALDDLSDVDAAAPADANVLFYNDGSSVWEAGSIPTHNHDASTINTGTINVARLGSGAVGAGNKYLADDNTFKTIAAGVTSLPGLSDVDDAVAPTDGHVLIGDGVEFESRLLVAADIDDFTEITLAENEFLVGTAADPEGKTATEVLTLLKLVRSKTWSGTVVAASEAVATGNGIAYIPVPAALNGMNIVSVQADVMTAGTASSMLVQIARLRAGTPVDVLSTRMTIDSAETSSATGSAFAIDTANDDLATGDQLRVDVDQIHTTPALGLMISITAELP
jgi:hypothetical protein